MFAHGLRVARMGQGYCRTAAAELELPWAHLLSVSNAVAEQGELPTWKYIPQNEDTRTRHNNGPVVGE